MLELRTPLTSDLSKLLRGLSPDLATAEVSAVQLMYNLDSFDHHRLLVGKRFRDPGARDVEVSECESCGAIEHAEGFGVDAFAAFEEAACRCCRCGRGSGCG